MHNTVANKVIPRFPTAYTYIYTLKASIDSSRWFNYPHLFITRRKIVWVSNVQWYANILPYPHELLLCDPKKGIVETLNSQGNLKNFLFKVLTIRFYTFCPSFRQIMDTIPKKLFLFEGKPFDEPFSTSSKLAKRCSASECPIDAKR